MLIYAIRHGETDWNVEGRLQGTRDVPLNDRGRAQAAGNGRRLLTEIGHDLDAFDFVASPLGRTRETMEIIRGELGLPRDGYRMDDRLIEVCFGDWEGSTLAEVDAATPGAVAVREADKWYFIPPGQNAESYDILSWRVAAWLKSVSRPTVMVAHGGVIRSLFRLIADMPPAEAAAMRAHQDRPVKLDDDGVAWLEP